MNIVKKTVISEAEYQLLTMKNIMTEDKLIFTTAIPKSDEELDRKVFLTEQQMATKILNGDFLYAN